MLRARFHRTTTQGTATPRLFNRARTCRPGNAPYRNRRSDSSSPHHVQSEPLLPRADIHEVEVSLLVPGGTVTVCHIFSNCFTAKENIQIHQPIADHTEANAFREMRRSEERRVGKECRSRRMPLD